MYEKPPRVRNTSAELTHRAWELRREMTPAESVLWEALRARRLDGLRFRAQHPVETFILDFYCPAHKLVVEVDGTVHDGSDAQEHDALRAAHITAHGYRVVRFRNEAVLNDLPSVLDALRAAVTIDPSQADEEESGAVP